MQSLRKEGITAVILNLENYYCSEGIIIMKKRLSIHMQARIAIVNEAVD